MLAYVLIVNFITFLLYGLDKSRARRGALRIPEARLHTFSLAGGSIGALIGQKVFHHKTRKFKFQVVFWLTVILQVALVLGVIYLYMR